MRESSYRADAVAKYLELRQARGRDVASRRALAEAEAEAARYLDRGRHITDDGRELTARSGGRVRVRQLNTEPREPGQRAIRRAQRYGYEGTAEQLREQGRLIRSVLRNLSREDLDAVIAHAREGWLADDDDDTDDTTATPATPTPTPKAASSEATGWGVDGVFRASRQQLRDPAWALEHQQDLVRAGAKLSLVD
jgi:hypothetical protein